jgi:hypothetical protein
MFIKFKLLSFMSIKYFTYVELVNWITGWVRSVGIATYYRLDGLKIGIPVGSRFSLQVTTSCTMGRDRLPGVKAVRAWCYPPAPSSSSSGPGAYAPDAPQPIGLLCDPCPYVIFRRSHFRRQTPPRPYDTRDPSSERWNCERECCPVILPQLPRYI